MTLEDGIYEVKDLFYEDAGYTLAVIGGKPEFAGGVGQTMRFRLEVLHPDRRFGKPKKIRPGMSAERGEFLKSLVKTTLAASDSRESLTGNVNAALGAIAGGAMVEAVAFVSTLMSGGLDWFEKGETDEKEHNRRDVYARSSFKKPGILSYMAKAIMSCPSYRAFRDGLARRHSAGTPEDIRLHGAYTDNPLSVPEYAWIKEDAEECRKILEVNPFFRECLLG